MALRSAAMPHGAHAAHAAWTHAPCAQLAWLGLQRLPAACVHNNSHLASASVTCVRLCCKLSWSESAWTVTVCWHACGQGMCFSKAEKAGLQHKRQLHVNKVPLGQNADGNMEREVPRMQGAWAPYPCICMQWCTTQTADVQSKHQSQPACTSCHQSS